MTGFKSVDKMLSLEHTHSKKSPLKMEEPLLIIDCQQLFDEEGKKMKDYHEGRKKEKQCM